MMEVTSQSLPSNQVPRDPARGIWGLGFRIWGLGFVAQGFELGVGGFRSRVEGVGFRVEVWGGGLMVDTPRTVLGCL